MNIRRAIPEDIPQIRELFQSTILHVNAKDYSPEQTRAWAARGDGTAHWEERISTQYFIVTEEQGAITGFAALRTDGCINSMFVHKDYQGRGIASALLADVVRKARQEGMRRLTADVSITARPFFEKRGFAVEKEQTVCIVGVEMRNYVMSLEI